ncbi:MAG: SHIRT domain-containing protein [Coriobacteriia bacterium]|nr:SHIRT domain-containing protein [Coriobacteriia bacterium]
MRTNRAQGSQPAKSMTEYYSLGHKIVAVVLALVLMGFGWPAVNPASIYAENDSETEQSDSAAEQKAEEKAAEEAAAKKAKEEAAAKKEQEAKAKEAAEKKAAEEAAAKKAEQEAAAKKAKQSSDSSSTKADSSFTKNSSSSDSSKDDKSESDEVSEYKITLDLGNASIKVKSSNNQVLTAPATKVTVPAGKDFKFTVTPNEGYELTKVALKSSSTKTLKADSSDVYTIAASDLTEGMKITLKTKKQESSTTETDATPIEETEDTDANKAAVEEVTDNTGEAESDDVNADESNENAISIASETAEIDFDGSVSGNDTLEVGKFAVYTADGFSDAVTWASSDESLATVDANGIVTGVAAGSVTITATYGDETASKTITITDSSASSNSRWSNGNTATFKPTISNADVAYFNWHSDSDMSSISFTPVSSGGTLSISDYYSRYQAGYVVFFVKPNSNYLFTGLGADGNGDTYVVGSGSYGNIANYPKIDKVMKAAKAAGYVAAFGYSRTWGETPLTNCAFQVKAQSPDMTIAATSDKTSDVLAGDTLTFTIVMTPQLTGSGRDKVTDVKVNSVTVNGKSVECSKIVDNGDGTYTTTVTYTVSEADCSRSTVELKVDATSTYEASLSTSLGSITTTASINKTATASCAIAPKIDVAYEFKSGTSGKELPDGIYKLVPKDSNKYQKGVKVTASKTPASGAIYEDADNDGYWTFEGWDANTKTMTEDGITFIGTWTFAEYSKYTIKYVDEQGNELAESKTVSGNKVGDKIKVSNIEKPEIEGYSYSKANPSSTLTIDSDESKNVITIIYKAKAGKAGYNLVLGSASWTAPEDTSQQAGSQKWYYNYGFAKGDTFTVTSAEPSAENHAFIGWMDKERDGQAAAIRGAGDSVTYCYSNDQTYTLDALWASLSATGGEYVYDGTSHTVSVDVNINEGTGLGPKYVEQAKKLIKTGDIKYSTDGGKTWSPNKPSFTDAGEYTVKVKQDVTVGDKTTTLTAEATVKIAKKAASITAGSAEKEYDGTALTTNEFTTEGFVEGQGIASATIEGSQTVVGSSSSTVKDNSWTAQEGTNLNNYTITTKPGTLEVTPVSEKVTVTITEHGGSYTYDGTEKTATGYDVSSSNDLYTADCFSFSGNANVSGTDAGTYEMKLKASDFKNTSKNFSNVEFKIVDATLAIAKRNVTLTSASDEKVYDGNALTNDNVSVSEDGFAEGEGATYDVTGTITNVGNKENAFTYTLNSGTNKDNYNITQKTGELVVTPVTDEVVVKVVGNKGGQKYNGSEQSVKGYTISADNTLYNVNDDVEFSGTAVATGTDANTYYMGLSESQFKNTNDNFTNVKFEVTDGELVIAKRQVLLKSGSKEKEYDGTALTNHKVERLGDGFASREGVSTVVTGSQTLPGSSENIFTYSLHAGTKADNYEITVQYGTLTVTNRETQYEITVEANSETATYDGQQHSATGLKTTSFVVNGKTYNVSGLTTEDPVETNAGTYTNNITGTPVVTDENGNIVTDQFKVSTKNGSLTIGKREVTLESQSGSKPYDGTALTKPEVTISDELFKSETSNVTATGSVTNVSEGKVTNAITYTAGEKFNENNYKITKTEGELWITSKSIEDPSMNIDSPENKVYDGAEHKWAPTVKDGDKVLTKDVDYTVEYSTEDFTNVTGAITVTITGIGNYEGSVAKSYQITPAPYNVVTYQAYKDYDGEALTAGGKIEGIVNGEDAGFVVTGRQIAVGHSNNTYTVKWDKTAKKSNYYFAGEELGQLTVGEYSGQIIVTTVGGTFTYDGKAHGATVTVSMLPDGYHLDGTPSSSASATDVTSEPVKATADNLVIRNSQGDDVTSKLNIKHNDGTIVVNSAILTVTTPDATKVYDGTPLTAAGSYSGLVNDETVEFKTTGTQTDKGESTNTYEIAWTGTAKQSNYTVSESLGTLTVTEQSIVPDDPAYKGVEINDPTGKIYDGVELKWIPKVKDAKGNALAEGTDYTVTYKRDGKETTDFTNVGTIEVTITGKGNYTGTVTKKYQITKAPLEVSTPDATKVYDGTPLTAAATAENISGLVAGETATVKATGSQTEVGHSANTYSGIEWGTAKESNYYVKSKTEGTLTVTKQSIVPDPDNPDSYKGIEISDPEDKTYDGDEHKWAPEVTAKDGSKLTEGTDYTVEYSTTDFTNVGTIEVTITGTGNYTGTVTKTYKITKRPVTLTSESHTFTYNGKAQSWNKFTCSDDLFASQVDDLGCTVTVKNAGEQKTNTVSYAFKSGFSADNYEITNGFGTLYVKNSEDEIVATTTGGAFTYDGQAHGATVEVSSLPDGYTLDTASSSATATNVADGEVAATADALVIRNAEGEDVTKDLKITYIDGTIKIVPAELRITTGTAAKAYDGTALTNSDLKIAGLVGTDAVIAKTTGAQTEVGSSANTYEIDWGTTDANNYSIVESLGTLTVTKAAVTPSNNDGDNDGNGGNGGTTRTTPAATPAAPAAAAVNNVDNTVTRNTEGETIYDAENPLGTTEAECWVHYYMIICMILTALYGIGVWAHRANYTRRLRKDMDDVMNDGDGINPEKGELAGTSTVTNQA